MSSVFIRTTEKGRQLNRVGRTLSWVRRKEPAALTGIRYLAPLGVGLSAIIDDCSSLINLSPLGAGVLASLWLAANIGGNRAAFYARRAQLETTNLADPGNDIACCLSIMNDESLGIDLRLKAANTILLARTSGDPRVFFRSMEGLGDILDRADKPYIVPMLRAIILVCMEKWRAGCEKEKYDHEYLYYFRPAVEALIRIGDTAAIPILKEVIFKSPHRFTQPSGFTQSPSPAELAVKALGSRWLDELSYDSALSLHKRYPQMLTACDLARHPGCPRSNLIAYLGHENESVRGVAINRLAGTLTANEIASIGVTKNRNTAYMLVKEPRCPRSIFMAYLGLEDQQVRAAAIDRLTGTLTENEIAGISETKDNYVAWVLSRESHCPRSNLIAYLDHEDQRVRAVAIERLAGTLSSDEILEPAKRAAQNNYHDVLNMLLSEPNARQEALNIIIIREAQNPQPVVSDNPTELPEEKSDTQEETGSSDNQPEDANDGVHPGDVGKNLSEAVIRWIMGG